MQNPTPFPWLSGIIGVVAGIGASACCGLPLLLVSAGLGGSWLASLAALEPFRPWLIVATLSLLGYAGWRLYRSEPACEEDAACANPAVKKRQRIIFWLVTLPLLAAMAFPWYASWLLN